MERTEAEDIADANETSRGFGPKYASLIPVYIRISFFLVLSICSVCSL